MSLFNELGSAAEDALRSVRDLIENLEELEDEGGVVEEFLYDGEGFLVRYDTDVGTFLFRSEDGESCLVKADEYNEAKDSAQDLMSIVPSLMVEINHRN